MTAVLPVAMHLHFVAYAVMVILCESGRKSAKGQSGGDDSEKSLFHVTR
jgi:hypothetical protein